MEEEIPFRAEYDYKKGICRKTHRECYLVDDTPFNCGIKDQCLGCNLEISLEKANYRIAKGTELCNTCPHNNGIQTDINEVGCDLFEVWIGAWMTCDNQTDRE